MTTLSFLLLILESVILIYYAFQTTVIIEYFIPIIGLIGLIEFSIYKLFKVCNFDGLILTNIILIIVWILVIATLLFSNFIISFMNTYLIVFNVISVIFIGIGIFILYLIVS